MWQWSGCCSFQPGDPLIRMWHVTTTIVVGLPACPLLGAVKSWLNESMAVTKAFKKHDFRPFRLDPELLANSKDEEVVVCRSSGTIRTQQPLGSHDGTWDPRKVTQILSFQLKATRSIWEIFSTWNWLVDVLENITHCVRYSPGCWKPFFVTFKYTHNQLDLARSLLTLHFWQDRSWQWMHWQI